MPNVDFLYDGHLIFQSDPNEELHVLPRIHEVIVVDSNPYVVVDVEYKARRKGKHFSRRDISPKVYLRPISEEDWNRRLERRGIPKKSPNTPLRY